MIKFRSCIYYDDFSSSRQLIFCALAVLAEERNPLECLDAFGATGKENFVTSFYLILIQ